MMKLIIISGRSGSGKSTVLHVLEDMGFYCIDNLPAALLPSLIEQTLNNPQTDFQNIAASIDARNIPKDIQQFPRIINKLDKNILQPEIIYLDADDYTLIRRFSETRRKHPLSNEETSLSAAIIEEIQLLKPIANLADLIVDTSQMNIRQLRDFIRKRINLAEESGLALLFQSFAYKNGVPVDADIVYDVRCLPNPYWISHLRTLTGKDKQVVEFLQSQLQVQELLADVQHFLEKWLPAFEHSGKRYMTVGLGCTGGQHRSVYISEQLKNYFTAQINNVQIHHRELS